MEEEIVDPREAQFEALARKAPEVTIVSDHALVGKECYRDSFNLMYQLGPVLDVIRHPGTRTPMAVAIYGDWGTGKTSAMKWLEQLLQRSNTYVTPEPRSRIKTIWFDPWKYHTKDDVWRGLVAEVIIKSIDVDEATIGTVVNAAKKFGLFLGRSFMHVLAGLKVKGKAAVGPEAAGASVEAEYSLSNIKEILTDYRETAHPESAYLNDFEAELQNWINDTLEPDERMVIFIDDLDRCMPDIALQVLEALKLYLNIEKLIFVVGVDRGVIDELVKGYYDKLKLSEAKSQSYLAKMFQVEVQLAPRHIQIRDFLGEQLGEVGYWKGLDEHEQDIFQQLILKLSVHNPREVKRLVNSALMSAAGFVMLPEMEAAQGISFAQGLQQYFIRRILEKPEYRMADILKGEAAHSFFRAWSQIVTTHEGHADFSRTVRVPTEIMEHRAGKPGAEKSKAETIEAEIDLAEALPGLVPHAYEPLLRDRDFTRFLVLLADEDLGELMRIPYPEEEGASAIREVTVSLDEADPILQAMARQLGKEASAVTREDYRLVTRLDLMNTGVTDLAPLEGLVNLQYLYLNGTGVTDLTPLKGLANVQLLDLSSTGVTDLTPLKGLTNLQKLDLMKTDVADLTPLKGLENLKNLYLSGTGVTDLTPLQRLAKLCELSLHETKVTDLAPLQGLANLQYLGLTNTVVTGEEVAGLRKALPGLTIRR